MSNNNSEVTISTLQADNAALKVELDSLKSRIQQKDAQDRDDKVAAVAKAQAQTQNKLIQFQKPTNGYTAPKPEDEQAARRIFGRGSDSRAANNMALRNMSEYSRLRQVALDLQLIS